MKSFNMTTDYKFRNTELEAIWAENHIALLESSFHYYQLHFDELVLLFKTYKTQFKKLEIIQNEKLNESQELKNFSNYVLKDLTKLKVSMEYLYSEEALLNYDTKLAEILKKTPLILPRQEIFIPYQLNATINIPLFFNKLTTNIRLNLKSRYRKIINVFRKLLDKEPLEVQSYRNRRIPLRNLLSYFLGNSYKKTQLKTLQELFVFKSEFEQKLWHFDTEFLGRLQQYIDQKSEGDFFDVMQYDRLITLEKEMHLQLKEVQKKFNTQNKIDLLDTFIQLDEKMLLADTPDLPSNQFKTVLIKQHQSQTKYTYKNMIAKWANTQQTFLDDWAMDMELMLLYLSIWDEYNLLKNKISNYITENLSLNLEKLQTYIQASYKNISLSTTSVDLRRNLKNERKNNSDILVDKMLTNTINKLSGKINQHLELYHQNVMKLADQVSNKRAFVKGRNYTKEIKSNEISWLSPRDLLSFEALPHFLEAIQKVEDFVSSHLEKARIKLIALGTVSDFSLESAQLMLAENKGSLATAQQTVSDGYNRALTHLNEAEELLNKIKTEPLEDLQKAIYVFNNEIQKLKNAENVLDLQVKIVRIRTVERSKKVRRETLEWVIHFWPKSKEFVNEHFVNIMSFITEMKKKVGMTNEKSSISHELSDFLKKTEISLKKLPFIYQRLYQLTPTSEDRFFVGRKDELKQLESAYYNWQNDRFITTAIIGEKGSGVSSLILYFLKKIDQNLDVIHLEINSKIYEPEAYYQFFAKAFNQKSFVSNEEIIHYVNQKKEHSIFIIENLQHLYLKIVKGFVCQKMFFELIASTWSKIFWVVSYTTHSWEYLEKTLQISSVFIKEIKLVKFTDDNLETIIFKRNYLSGYKINFLASESNSSSKSFQKLDADGRQNYLKKTFFKELNQMSNGNVSLAQLYWLRSTQDTDEDTIKIQSLRDFDISFDKDLPTQYLFALHAILVHDGLVISDYSKVFNLPAYACRNVLTPMLEKGLLIKPKDKYNINPIIYRQVVDLLHSHNFIN